MKRLIADCCGAPPSSAPSGGSGGNCTRRLEMQRPAEDQTTAEAESDPLQESLDALREDVATLNEKVDAMMVAMLQLKR
jgi:hypothetical protein